MMPRKAPWQARVNDAQEARFVRAALALGYTRDGELNQSAFMKAGADALVLQAARARLDSLGGLMAAVEGKASGIRTLLCDVIAAGRGDEERITEALGVAPATWRNVLRSLPDVERALVEERARVR